MIGIQTIDKNGVRLINGKTINILKVEPVNFKLKSLSEQNIILESYKQFLKQCDFDFQIFVQTQKADAKKHIAEIEKCVLYEVDIADMAEDYINLIKEISEVRGSISRKFYIVINTNENNMESRVTKIIEGLRNCGNIVERCNEDEILKIFQSCFKNMLL